MNTYQTFAVLGGDLRQVHVANRLAARGKTVYALLMEKNCALSPGLACGKDPARVLPACDVVILPMPMTTDERTINSPFSDKKLRVADCLARLRPDTVVLAGKVSDRMRELARAHKVPVIDYLEREELAVKNAAVAAEGALTIALEELPVTLLDAQCLVTGRGRLARALMRVLRGVGAQVTVAARRCGDLAEIEAAGCRAVHTAELAEHVAGKAVLFNTVPARLFTRPVLARLDREALLIDLASRPGGVDLNAAGELGVKAIWALSLPGKCAPLTAGDIILETVDNCLAERGAL